MKSVVIVLSLIVNAVLCWHLARDAGAGPSAMPGEDRRDQAVTPVEPSRTSPPLARVSAGIPGQFGNGASVVPKWSDLAGADPAGFVARLAAAAWPQAEIRSALEARFAVELEARRQELEAAAPRNPYWKYPSAASELLTELSGADMAELRELARSHARQLDELAGPDTRPAMPPGFSDQRRFAGLPAEKVDLVRMLEQDYADLAAILRRDVAIFPLPEDARRAQILMEARQKDLSEMLSADELAEYEVRSSPVADRLRNQMIAFEPSESEFRAIFQIQSVTAREMAKLEAAFNVGTMTAADRTRRRQQLESAAKDQIEVQLGPVRFAEYAKAIEPANRTAWINSRK